MLPIDENPRLRRLIGVSFALLVIVCASFVAVLNALQRSTQKVGQTRALDAQNMLTREIEIEAQRLLMLLDLIQRDARIDTAWKMKDWNSLEETLRHIHRNHLAPYQVDEILFQTAERDQQFRSGATPLIDPRTSNTLQTASGANSTSFGLEINSQGQLSLQASLPWNINDQHRGVFGMALNLQHIPARLASRFDCNIFLLLRKPLVDRTIWEAAAHAAGKPVNWNELSDYVISQRTQQEIPESIRTLINMQAAESTLPIFDDSRHFTVHTTPLVNQAKEKLGSAVFVFNMTKSNLTQPSVLVQVAIAHGLLALTILGIIVLWHVRYRRKIREMQQAKQELEKQSAQVSSKLSGLEERFSQFAVSLRDACFQVDSQGRVVFWNPAAEKIFGYQQTEAQGRFLHELVAPSEYHAFWQKAFSRFVSTGKGRAVGKIVERMAMRKDGSLFPIELSLSAVRVSDEWNAIGIVRDISRQRNQEADLRHARQTAENSLRELKQAVHRAHRNALHARLAMKSKADFISHMTQLVRSSVEGTHSLLMQRVEEVAEYSVIEAKKLSLQHVVFDLAKVTDAAVAMLLHKASARGLQCGYHVDPALPQQAIGDPVRIQQILTNLIENAVRFTDEGRVDLSIEVTRQNEAQMTLRCIVTDTGIGIAAADLNRIFSAFALRKRGRQESGLGLAISRQLIEMMGGQIRVKSEEGEGSSFMFSILLDKVS